VEGPHELCQVVKGLEVYGKDEVVGKNEAIVTNGNGPSGWTWIFEKLLKVQLSTIEVVVHTNKIAHFRLKNQDFPCMNS
jgi:hypothetical protein